MALQKRAMISDRSETGRNRIVPEITDSVVFAQAGGDKELPVGTVLAFDTSVNGWVEWANGGLNGTDEVRAVVFPDPITILLAGEVTGTVMLKGEAHRDDLVSDGGTSTQLDAELAANALRRGIRVKELADVR